MNSILDLELGDGLWRLLALIHYLSQSPTSLGLHE